MRGKLALACMFTFISGLYAVMIPNILYADGSNFIFF